MLTRTICALALGIALPSASAAFAQAPLRLVDAHTHLIVDSISADEEIAMLKKFGIDRVVLMHTEPEVLVALTKKYPGYVIPSLSISRQPTNKGMRLDETTAPTMTKLYTERKICGFGEIPGRFEGAAGDIEKFRAAVYAAAAVTGAPVNAHIDLATPEIIAAVEAAAAANPKLHLVLAHAGWTAGPALMGRLLDAHPNIYTDLSIRIDAPGSLPWRNNGQDLSILTAEGGFQPGWRELIERHPDRFLFAMDINSFGPRYTITEDLVVAARKALATLRRPTQEAVAHGNIERLLHGCGR